MFQPGDHVRQGGHGPVMTVKHSNAAETACEWIEADGKPTEQTFPSSALVRTEHLSDPVTEEMIEHRH